MFGFQVKINGQWLWVCTSSGSRYEYETEDKAQQRMEMCYPDQIREARLGGEQKVRVKEIPND